MNYKKFDLTSAKKGARVCTKAGHEVKIISFDVPGEGCIVGYCLDQDNPMVMQYDKSGGYVHAVFDGIHDLVMMDKK